MRQRETILITGASTGLGLALAHRLVAADRWHLVLTARESSLPRFADAGIEPGPNVWLRALDIRVDSQRRAVISEIDEKLGGVYALINNAGVAYRTVIEHMGEADRLAQMDINFRGPMELVRLALPMMRAKRRGRIIAISSVGGMMAMPTMGLYAASKFALEGAHEALWYEVRPWGIPVTLVQPGFVRADTYELVQHTALSARGRTDVSDPYHAHYRAMGSFIERVMRRWALFDHDAVARIVENTIVRPYPPLRVLATPDAWLFSMLRRLLPQRFYHWLLYALLPHINRWGPRPTSLPPAPYPPLTAPALPAPNELPAAALAPTRLPSESLPRDPIPVSGVSRRRPSRIDGAIERTDRR